MPSVRWRKVLRDLGTHRLRTALVVVSIAVGVFAVGTIAGSDALLQANLRQGYAASRPASATFYTSPFGDDLVDLVRGMPQVAEAEARRVVTLRLKTGPDTYRELDLTAIRDFEDQRLDLVTPESGRWPPRRGEVLFERSSVRLVPELATATSVVVVTTDGKEHSLRVAGLSHEVGGLPAFYIGAVLGHVGFDTLAELGLDDSYVELRFTAAAPSLDRAQTQAVADQVRDRIERAGTSVYFTIVPVPGRHPADDLLQGFFVVLGFIGFLALVVAAFLVVNTVNAVIAQQVRQIGVMKAVGARSRQVAGIYLGLVIGYSLLALVVALPLGALGAWALTDFTAGLANFDVIDRAAPPHVIALEVAVGLLVPLVAAAVPIWRGVRVTVREALATTGIGDRFGRARLDRALQRIRGLPRPTILSIRNTFRRKARLALTVAALSLAGAVFMSVFSVRASLQRTLDEALGYFAFDVQVQLAEPARVESLAAEVSAVPGVALAEPWRLATANRLRSNGTDGRSTIAFGLPPEARTIRPVLQEGRWLLPEDGNALVATSNYLEDEEDLAVGDTLTLRINGRDSTWTLVGIAQSPTQRSFLYANDRALELAAREVGRTSVVMVVTQGHDAASQDRVARAVSDRLGAAGINVAAATTMDEVRTTQESLFDVLIVFLSSMAVVLGVVGGLGLTGTMTINVVERAREIGVIRAVGASNAAVRWIFLVEGLLIGLLAWALGAAMALPISLFLSNTLGLVFIRRPLAFAYSPEGAILWLAVVVALAALATLLPAWRASRVAVRQVLAYE